MLKKSTGIKVQQKICYRDRNKYLMNEQTFIFVEAMAKMIEMLEEWQENLNRRQTQIQARNLQNLKFYIL